MGFNSGIHWTDDTFNPWWGCTNVSPACDNCYAETFAHRMQMNLWGKDAPRRFFGDKHWNEPLKWNRLAERNGIRRRCFTGSMCDIMERLPILDEPRQRLYRLIEQTDWLDWLLLSKRPQEYIKLLPASWLKRPRHNAWLMTTVENSDYLWRIKALMEAPAVIYGISLEPLMNEVTLPKEFLDLGGRGWVIVGGESGCANAAIRRTEVVWVRKLRDACVEAGVPFHFKQWGEYGPHNGDQLVRLGVKNAGRTVDGREWDEVPKSVVPTVWTPKLRCEICSECRIVRSSMEEIYCRRCHPEMYPYEMAEEAV